MSLFNQFKTDATKENEGIEIELSEVENEDGTSPIFIIARMGKSNKAYQKALDVAIKPHRRKAELGVMKNEVAEAVIRDVFCETVLKGWKNVYHDDGNPMQFNRENAITLMVELPELYERLQEEAKLISNFRFASLEAEAKN